MTSKKTKTYAELRAELDKALAWFDSEELDIDAATTKYEAALKLVKELESYLTTAENTIKKISLK